jgi:hypothetical protein
MTPRLIKFYATVALFNRRSEARSKQRYAAKRVRWIRGFGGLMT